MYSDCEISNILGDMLNLYSYDPDAIKSIKDMFKFLFVMFFMFLLLMFLMGFSILRMAKRFFFGPDNNSSQQAHRSSSRKQSSSSRAESAPRKKIFDQSDGEYVDYEEVE